MSKSDSNSESNPEPVSGSISVALIVAMASNRVIGRDNQLPWHLPNDLKYFKSTTMGKPIIMGRKTYESIGRPLPGRTNIVVSTNPQFTADGVEVVCSIDRALEVGVSSAMAQGASEVMVIGGAKLYAEMLPRVSRLYLTQVLEDISGDAFFPELDWNQWEQISSEDFLADGPNPHNHRFCVFERIW